MDRNIRWLAFGAVVRAAGLSLISPFIALYLRNVLGLGYLQIGLLVALLAVLPITILPFAGAIADRLGRRPVFLVSLALEAGGVLATGASMHAQFLVGVLAAGSLVSAAGAIGGPALSAYVADLAQGADRTEGFTWFRIGWNLGFTTGVFAGGALIGVIGFPEVGFAAGAVLIASTSLLALVLEPTPYDRDRARGIARPTGGSRAGTWNVLARDRGFLLFCAVFAVLELSVNQWQTTFPLYANTVVGLPYADIGLGLALNGVLVVVAQAPTTRAAHGHRHTSLMVLGTALYVGGFLFFGVVELWRSIALAGFLAAVLVLTMGENVLSIPTSTLPSNVAPAGEVGAYNGAFFAFLSIGQVLATTLGGLVLALGLSSPVTWAILMVPAVPALLVGQRWVVPRISATANRA